MRAKKIDKPAKPDVSHLKVGHYYRIKEKGIKNVQREVYDKEENNVFTLLFGERLLIAFSLEFNEVYNRWDFAFTLDTDCFEETEEYNTEFPSELMNGAWCREEILPKDFIPTGKSDEEITAQILERVRNERAVGELAGQEKELTLKRKDFFKDV